jgi:hypothetical protein
MINLETFCKTILSCKGAGLRAHQKKSFRVMALPPKQPNQAQKISAAHTGMNNDGRCNGITHDNAHQYGLTIN